MHRPLLKTARLVLRSPEVGDAEQIQDFEERNREHLSPWETLPTESITQRLNTWNKEINEGRSVRLLLLPLQENRVIGMCNFTQIFRGGFQACYLGYKIDHIYQGQGFMTEALMAAIPYIFNEMHLHRIMANYIPSNDRSAHLLNRLGFTIEGHAKDYLLINERWEDHVLTSKTNPHWTKL